jgi:hypothetical protein
LPLAAVIQTPRDKIFCCHAGISRDLVPIAEIRKIRRPVTIKVEPKNKTEELIADLTWSDPQGTLENGVTESERDCYSGHFKNFGPDRV